METVWGATLEPIWRQVEPLEAFCDCLPPFGVAFRSLQGQFWGPCWSFLVMTEAFQSVMTFSFSHRAASIGVELKSGLEVSLTV